MDDFQKLKTIIDEHDFNTEAKSQMNDLLNDIEEKLEELEFLNARYERDRKVNKNFVKKTVELLEKSNEDLTKSNIQLKKTNEELERFAFIASHDLKTPLLNIISFTELLRKKLASGNVDDIEDYMRFIIQGGKRMHALIEDVLEYSKNSKQNIDDEHILVSLTAVIEEITTSISAYISDRNAVIEVLPPLPDLIFTPSKVKVLFKNLIENGIKYNESSAPTVKIRCEYTNERCLISVEDNGIGIEKKFHDKVFQMFGRLHNYSKYEGTGLGLAMCKKVVEEMNGNIHLESQPGKTIFTIDLPIEFALSKLKNGTPITKT